MTEVLLLLLTAAWHISATAYHDASAPPPALLDTRAAQVYLVYTSSISACLERSSHTSQQQPPDPPPPQAEGEAVQVATKRKFAHLQDQRERQGRTPGDDEEGSVSASTEGTVQGLQLVLLSLSRVVWEEVVLVSCDLATQVAALVQAYYKRLPLLLSAPAASSSTVPSSSSWHLPLHLRLLLPGQASPPGTLSLPRPLSPSLSPLPHRTRGSPELSVKCGQHSALEPSLG